VALANRKTPNNEALMSAPPFFPTLSGQGWSVHKKPTFSNIVASHVSGREVRAALYQNPIWQFELTFDGLDGTASGAYGGLGASSLQGLMGLFLQCQGQFGSFLYYDPTDYSVAMQPFGTGDGTTTTFQLQRTLGGFSEPVTQPFAPGAPTLFQVQGSPQAYAPNNLMNYSGDLTNSAWIKTNVAVTSGIADPFSGTAAQTVTATAAAGFFAQFGAAAGANYVSSLWARRRTGSGAVRLYDPAHDATYATLALTGSWQKFSIAGPPGSGNAYNVLYLAVSGDAVDVYGPQVEQSLVSTPGPYFQTLASDYCGGPWITAAGALVDPSAYTIANGAVTFSTAPANGAALAWTGYFAFLCRFDGDDLSFEQFMANLWRADSVKFRSLRAQ
jgi:hypothetical protein